MQILDCTVRLRRYSAFSETSCSVKYWGWLHMPTVQGEASAVSQHSIQEYASRTAEIMKVQNSDIADDSHRIQWSVCRYLGRFQAMAKQTPLTSQTCENSHTQLRYFQCITYPDLYRSAKASFSSLCYVCSAAWELLLRWNVLVLWRDCF